MYERQILACETEIRKIVDWPDSDEKTKWLEWDYSIWSEYKKKQLYEEREIVTRSILDERPNFPEGLSKEERILLVLKHTIANELSRNPIEYMGLGIFVHEWWRLKVKLATEETDKRYPHLKPEERDACIHVLSMEGDPN
ncbi:MAG: hypothetical protein ABSG67_11430 [Thermoguttaceae bacterium]|jgi:hypothetical protein